jgi:[protein-PII] uridylyltransferase
VEQLKALTLLTYADVSAVHPGAMTPWRLEQLWSAYMCTHRELTRELVTDRIQAKPSELPDVLDGFPTRYLLTHLEPEVQAHVRLLERSEETGAAVEIEKRGSVYVLAAVAKDRPYLFASIAGALASFGLNIVKAEAFNNRRGDVLDTFSFEDPGRNLELNASEVDRLRLTLERVLLGRIEVKELLRGRPHSPPPSKKSVIKPSVVFDGEASETATLIEIVAQDRPGLLYDLASTISKSRCNIEVVLIDTEAHKAIDVFYITRDGRKLTTAEELELQSELLRAAD